MKASHRAVGRLWLVLGIPIIVGCWACGNGQGGVLYNTVAENAGGLERGSPVLIRGVKVGEVRDLSFVERSQVRVVFAITAADAPQPHRDGCVAIEPHGLAGAARLALDVGAASSPPLMDGDQVAECSRSGAPLDEVAEQMGRLIQKVYAGDGVVSRLINDEELATKLERFLDQSTRDSDSGSGDETAEE